MDLIVVLILLIPLLFWMTVMLIGALVGGVCAMLTKNRMRGFGIGFGLVMVFPYAFYQFVTYGPEVQYAYNRVKFRIACRRSDHENTQVVPVVTHGVLILDHKISYGIGGGCHGLCEYAERPSTYLHNEDGPSVDFVDKVGQGFTAESYERVAYNFRESQATHAIQAIYNLEGYMTELRVQAIERHSGKVVGQVRQLGLGPQTCPSDTEMRALIRGLVIPARDDSPLPSEDSRQARPAVARPRDADDTPPSVLGSPAD